MRRRMRSQGVPTKQRALEEEGKGKECADDRESESINKQKTTAMDESLREVPIGKGLGDALQWLKGRGALTETDECGGGFTNKKRKASYVGVDDDSADGSKEIRIERRDEFGRIMTPKEAYRADSHKFHGKVPGKRAQEKRLKRREEELRSQYNADKPSQFAERMSELQARSNTPHIVLQSGGSR